MTVRSLYQWTRRTGRRRIDVISQRPRDKSGTQIDSDGREPNHENPEQNAMWRIQQTRSHVSA